MCNKERAEVVEGMDGVVEVAIQGEWSVVEETEGLDKGGGDANDAEDGEAEDEEEEEEEGAWQGDEDEDLRKVELEEAGLVR